MDPFSNDSELVNLQSAFYSGQYESVFNHDISSFSSATQPQARIYTLRAQIALGKSQDVITKLSKEKSPALQAVRALAEYTSGKKSSAVSTIEKLAASEDASEDSNVQVLGAIVLLNEGRTDEATSLLEKHSGSLEAIALLVQLQLQQNRVDLAQKEVIIARRAVQDDLLINIAESWVGMRVGGEKYQQAFYVFEELAQATTTSAALSLVSQAVAEIHQERYEEAEGALNEALEKDPQNEDALANMHVLSILMNKKDDSHSATLAEINDSHPLLSAINEKSDLFDMAAAKFTVAA